MHAIFQVRNGKKEEKRKGKKSKYIYIYEMVLRKQLRYFSLRKTAPKQAQVGISEESDKSDRSKRPFSR